MHILITGASSGIGWALAKAFDAPKNTLSLVARREAQLKELQAQIQTRAFIFCADLSDTSLVWLKKVEAQAGPVDIIINNAGVCYVEPTEGVSAERIQSLIQTNLTTPMNIIAELLPQMTKRKRGIIINISSEAALTPPRFYAHYNASKAGLAAYSESLNAELKPRGIHVMTVYPGPIRTPMEEVIKKQLKKTFFRDNAPTGTPEKLAQLIVEGIQKKKNRIIYPKIFSVARHLPSLGQWIGNIVTPPAEGHKTPKN